jgi:hypothetical protein
MAFSNLEKAMALVIGLDIAAPGFSRSAAKAAVGAIGRVVPPLATRTVAAGTGLAAANPALTGAAIGLGALQTQPGQQLLDIAAERGRMDRIRFEQALTDLTVGVQRKAKKRTKSRFNKLVSSGMATIKKSTSFGKKGVVTQPKRAFGLVTKAASAVTKGHKLPKSGIKRRIMSVMRKIR